MAAPVLSHLDPQMLAMMDDLRAQLATRVPRARGRVHLRGVRHRARRAWRRRSPRSFARGRRRGRGHGLLRRTARRDVPALWRDWSTASTCEWGRAADPDALRRALRTHGADVVAMVHAETSTGVLNPVDALCAIAREHGCLTIVDTVTSLAGHPVDMTAWGADAVYSGSQKAIGAPSGLAPITFSPRALGAGGGPQLLSRLKLLAGLLGRAQVSPHHFRAARLRVATKRSWRSKRKGSRRGGRAIAGTIACWPPASGRWGWSCSRRSPSGCGPSTRSACPTAWTRRRSAACCSQEFNLEVGAGLGPLAGRIWRVGLMGSGLELSAGPPVPERARAGAPGAGLCGRARDGHRGRRATCCPRCADLASRRSTRRARGTSHRSDAAVRGMSVACWAVCGASGLRGLRRQWSGERG